MNDIKESFSNNTETFKQKNDASLPALPYDIIRSMISELSVKKAYEFAEILYLSNEEAHGSLKDFGKNVLNGDVWEHFFKRDFPTAYTRALHFSQKENTERTKVTAEDSEKRRAYWAKQYTALYKAAYRGLTPGQQQLFQLVARNDVESIKKLFEKNRFSSRNLTEYDNNVSQTVLFKNSYSPIQLASIKKHQEILDVLYQIIHEEYKKESVTKNSHGWTLLDWAIALNQSEACESFLNIRSFSIDEKSNIGDFASYWACRNGHLEVAQLLIEKEPPLLNIKNNNGDAALNWACKNGHLEVVRLLIEKNPALLNTKYRYGRTILHLACENGHLEIAQLLIEKKPVLLNITNYYSNSPLNSACENGYVEMAQWLIEKNPALLDIINYHGDSPLNSACENGHLEMAQWLIEKNPALLNITNYYSNSPLNSACENGHLEMAQWLITKEPALLNVKNWDLRKNYWDHQIIELLAQQKKVRHFIDRAKRENPTNEISFIIKLMYVYLESQYCYHNHRDKTEGLLEFIREKGKEITIEKIREEIKEKNKESINLIGSFNSICEFILSERFDTECSDIKKNIQQISKKETAVSLLTSYKTVRFFQWRNYREEAEQLIEKINDPEHPDVENVIQTFRKDKKFNEGGFTKTLDKIQLLMI